MARLISVDKSWPEVNRINSYAIFMGYLMMGVRGLSLLVLTWTTVVLLGGFVSVLQKKDFWCLTLITLVQTAGVFDFLLKEKASDVLESMNGLMVALSSAVIGPFKFDRDRSYTPSKIEEAKETARTLVACIFLVVQVLVLAVVLCPVAVLYLLGLYISAGISLWRLIEHDYGNAEGGTNLEPALNVLYYLAVAQGVVFGYKAIYDLGARDGVVEEVASLYSLDTDLVSDYLDETVTGCMKDPSFGRERNLITYAVYLLMESKTHGSFISGIRIAGTALQHCYDGQDALIHQLLTGSASFHYFIQRLLEMLGPRSPFSSEIREHSARIVARVADCIHLQQFPGGMVLQCISSLLDTFEEYNWRPEYRRDSWWVPKEFERDWLLDTSLVLKSSRNTVGRRVDAAGKKGRNSSRLHGYEGLVLQGLRILEKLSLDEDNCAVMSSTEGLMPKIMGALISDQQIHRIIDCHDEWISMAEKSLQLMSQLMAAPGETGAKLRHQMSSNSRALVSTIQSILDCGKCNRRLQGLAVEILLDLSVDTSSLMRNGSSTTTTFVSSLVDLFRAVTHFQWMEGETRVLAGVYSSTFIPWMKKRSYVRTLAGQKLVALTSPSRENDAIILQLVGYVDDLTFIIIYHQNKRLSVLAAQILEHLCLRYAENHEYLKELKDTMADVMPKLLRKILSYGSTGQEIQATTEAANKTTYSTPDADVEKGRHTSQDNGCTDTASSSSHQAKSEREQHDDDSELQDRLMSICTTIRDRWIKADSDLARNFDKIAAKVCLEEGKPAVKTFAALMEEAQDILKKQV